ncbi:SixA phosphatase family protein [Cognatishimia activa]|uniref:Phosphohistidine phosphatase SixA n=2 Tax=Cognatishimia activa TaxID=1715691 RepID=A0A0P1IMJ2_9RHOB|nr:histidine phosphatase family protein [Cognatishimia activa]CUI31374.1 phosphohistidine phosphatase SixA [Cognatishimia activa]CUK24835.1 phosphohistidine phosphatase SixA [Cognatishimia activa]
MRHAKSSWHHSGPDHGRPLNERGYESAPKVGAWLRARGFEPDAILSSDAKRTRETCAGLGFDVPTRFERSLYLADPETMFAELKAETADTVLMLGHNPGIAVFADELVKTRPDHARFFDYPTCATTVMDFGINDWSQLAYGSGVVQGFAIPRELP